MSNKNSISAPLHFAALITSNGGIILSIFYLTLHCIDNVNYAMGFLKSEVTLLMILILSIFSALTSAFVLIILYRGKSKSYFFRKVAFISFWLCVFYALTHLKIVLPITIEKDFFKPIWFSISLFTIVTSVYCIGLLVMSPSQKSSSHITTPVSNDRPQSMSTPQSMNAPQPMKTAQPMNAPQSTNAPQYMSAPQPTRAPQSMSTPHPTSAPQPTNGIQQRVSNESQSYRSIEIGISDGAAPNNDEKHQ